MLDKSKRIDYKKIIKLILKELDSKNIIEKINRVNVFYDEPKFFYYIASINYPKKDHNGRQSTSYKIFAGGASLISNFLALLRCLGECVERFSLHCPKNKRIILTNFLSIHENALDPSIYINNSLIKKARFGWVEGYNFTKKTKCLIPAQLIYLDYKGDDKVQLTTRISTGASAGLTHETTLLRGIYEVVERDAFMTIYLNKITAPRIELKSIKNKTIQLIFNSLKRYNLEWFLFDITNDLNIPSFLTILVDKTRLGPAIAVGTKSSFNIKEAIISSVEESLMGRIFIKEKIKNIIINKKKMNVKIDYNLIRNETDRGLFWSSIKMLKKLDFLINQTPRKININRYKFNPKEELSRVNELIEKKGFQIYYADITPNNFRMLNYFVYKIIIPGLQPLYLDEKNKELNYQRLKEVSHYFNQKRYSVNKVPHPFL